MPQVKGNISSRVAYGDTAKKGLIPFAAFLEIEAGDDVFTCGGILIEPRVLLSAGRMVKGVMVMVHILCG